VVMWEPHFDELNALRHITALFPCNKTYSNIRKRMWTHFQCICSKWPCNTVASRSEPTACVQKQENVDGICSYLPSGRVEHILDLYVCIYCDTLHDAKNINKMTSSRIEA